MRKATFTKSAKVLEYWNTYNTTIHANCESVKYARFLIASCGVSQHLIKA